MTSFLPNFLLKKEPTVKSVRTLAKEEGVDLDTLLHILKLSRPDDTPEEDRFADSLLKHLEPNGAKMDDFGNIIVTIGESKTLWSSHTDTVDKMNAPAHKNLAWDGDILKLADGKPGVCLGADDGSGIWLMLEMIKAQKPGLYIFHRSEEVGGLGSRWIAKNTPSLLEGIERAIAFDRKGYGDVITHQSCGRGCSDTFAQALAAELNAADPEFNYEPDPTGSFTDTASYAELVPEITNLSVGYFNQHGPRETQDVMHLYRLRAALLEIDFEKLPTERDPAESDPYDYGGYGYYGGGYSYSSKKSKTTVVSLPNKEDDVLKEVKSIVWTEPGPIARWLVHQGFDADDLDWAIDEFREYPSYDTKGQKKIGPVDDADLAGEEAEVAVLVCQDCNEEATEEDLGNDPYYMQECPWCGSEETWVDQRPESEVWSL